ncbi:cupin domain-containing protein [Polynucleobacter sp. es-MAR-4]|uniref:cupin domain-containing protein n=1 Tax=Polynucleobacter sp. es-MAR-4 TaxID=1855655 RepID=UPI001C0B5911|nr:cupin domain-containing protein [Polynucleobacter sp. es-MAR-4]MBU3636085.1 cupin domain-containing protein [Polynucleobacter sp. es-MAR-4]
MRHLISLLLVCISISTFAQSKDGDVSKNLNLGEIKVTQILKTSKQWDGSPLPPYPSKNPEITILGYEIPPGTRLPMHKHPVINAGVVLQGKLTVITRDGKQLNLNSGDSIVELVDKWHYGVNQDTVPVKLIMFYVGEVGVPLVIKEND